MPEGRGRWLGIAILVFGGVAAYGTVRSTARYGIGISPDSLAYFQAAADLSRDGLRFVTANTSVAQPPLYPMLLVTTSRGSGGAVADAARFVAVVSSAAFVALILVTVSRLTRSVPVFLVTGVLACLSPPMSAAWAMAWTEPVFVVLVALMLLLVSAPQRREGSAVVIGCLAAAACLTRFAGVVPAFVAAVALASQSRSGTTRLRQLSLFALPLAVFALYLLRNYVVSGTLMGPRFPSQHGLAENVWRVAHITGSWALESPKRSWTVLALMFVAGASWYGRSAVVRRVAPSHPLERVWVLYGATYIVFLVWTSTTTAYDEINMRLMSPVYPTLIVLVAAWWRPETWRYERLRLLTLLVFALVVVLPSARAAHQEIEGRARNGAGGFSVSRWHDSQVIAYVREHGPGTAVLISNFPDALALLTGLPAIEAPARTQYNSEVLTGLRPADVLAAHPNLDGALLAWFLPHTRSYMFGLDDLRMVCGLGEVKTFPDGGLYTMRCGADR